MYAGLDYFLSTLALQCILFRDFLFKAMLVHIHRDQLLTNQVGVERLSGIFPHNLLA